MERQLPHSRALFWLLGIFALVSVASISLQNLIWVAVALFLFAHWKVHKGINWPEGLFPLATVLFLFTFFLGAAIGVDPTNSFLHANLQKYLTFLLVFPIGAMALEFKEIQKLLQLFVHGAVFCSFYGIGKHFFLHEERITSFSGDKMVFGGMLMVALLLGILLLTLTPKKIWLWLSVIIIAWALVLTETRGAWVGFLAGFTVLLWRLDRKWLLIGLLAACGGFFLLPRHYQDRIETIVHPRLYYDAQGRFNNSDPSRFMIWASGLRIIQDYPWGVGQGNLERIYPKYKYAAMGEPTEPHLHNNFLQICAQNGWIGLAAYLFWIFTYYLSALRFKSKNRAELDLNWTLICVFSAVLVWGLTEYNFSHQFMNFQFFALGLQLNLWREKITRP